MPENEKKAKSPGAALITGAGRRLGREIALGMATAGWDVIVHFNRSADEAAETVTAIESLGRKAVALAADLSDPAGVDRLFAQARDALPVNAVVNNASVFQQDTPADFTAQSLHYHLAPNLTAPMQLTRLLNDALNRDERGVVINILDQKLDNPNPDFFSYTLTKHALLGATRMMAMAFAPKLRVVGVSPGLTLPSYLQDAASFKAAHERAALLDRSSTPADIVAAVVFLAAQSAITGVNLTVDGGQHLMGLDRDVSYINFESE